MGIQQFELYHGAVLAKLMRNDHPITLRMFETNEDAWSVYTVNDEVELFVKVRTIANKLTREKDGLSWQFVFTPEQVERIRGFRNINKKVAIALVCGQQDVKNNMQIAFIEPDEVGSLLDFSVSSSQSLTVKYVPRKKLRVITSYTMEKLVSQNALEKWVVPGS